MANTDATPRPPALPTGAPLADGRPTLEGYVSQKTRGWEKRLITYLSECSRTPFRPGSLDCALFFARGVQAETGVDISAEYFGQYRSIREGYAQLRAKGFTDHVNWVEMHYPEWDSPLMGQRGDGAVVEDMNGAPALGIIQGASIYVMGLHGIGLVPLTAAKRAFHI